MEQQQSSISCCWCQRMKNERALTSRSDLMVASAPLDRRFAVVLCCLCLEMRCYITSTRPEELAAESTCTMVLSSTAMLQRLLERWQLHGEPVAKCQLMHALAQHKPADLQVHGAQPVDGPAQLADQQLPSAAPQSSLHRSPPPSAHPMTHGLRTISTPGMLLIYSFLSTVMVLASHNLKMLHNIICILVSLTAMYYITGPSTSQKHGKHMLPPSSHDMCIEVSKILFRRHLPGSDVIEQNSSCVPAGCWSL